MLRVFVVGTPRSGTTVLQRLVAAHPRITTFPESHFFDHLCRGGPWRRFLRLARRERARDGLLQFLERIGEAGRRSRRVEAIRSWRYGPWIRLFTGILDDLARERGADGWIEKTPIHLHHLATIARHVEGARVLHILRSGEEVVASLRRVTRAHPEGWGGERTVEECTTRWLLDVELHGRWLGRRNHLFVLYDDLVDDSGSVVSHVLDFLQLPGAGVDALEGQAPPDGMIGPDEPWKEGAARPVSREERTDPDQVLSVEERRYVRERTDEVDLSVFRAGGRAAG